MRSFERLVFYPAYCTRCYEHLLMNSLEDPCPICKQSDRIRHSIKDEDREDIMADPKKKKDKKKKILKEINREFNEAVTALQNSLVSLRIVTKYIQYDLEATRRENKVLKDKLQKYEGQNNQSTDSQSKT